MNARIQVLILVLFLGFSFNLSAQDNDFASKSGLSVKMVKIGYDAPYIANHFGWIDYGNGFEIAYNYSLSDQFRLYVPFRMAVAPFYEAQTHTRMAGADVILKHFLLKNPQLWDPYFMAGAGIIYENGGNIHGAIPLGVGIALNINKNNQLHFDLAYRFGLASEKRTAIQAGIGFTTFFGKVQEEIHWTEIDSDGDGIPDHLDECPDIPGLPEFNGCPDTDGDGIPDHLDECPDVPGLAEFNGCPDSDGDGIPDHLDECPDVPGLAEFNGCPDTDGDGIPDHLDECPDVAGLPEFNGCPDTDGDGIPDHLDECPDVPGLPEFDGCPDTDGDGIPDHLDLCPYTPGPKSNFGCPEIEEEDKIALEEAMEAVQFETAKATLKHESFKVLDNIVRIMNTYPDYDLRIIGHTDNVGSAQSNLILSQNRARSCYEYIASRGISTSRLSYVGFGESHPRDTNSTEAGRAKNRRVEFNLYVRK